MGKTKNSLSSKERILLTMNHQEPDRVPLMCKFGTETGKSWHWPNQFERIKELLANGFDDILVFGYYEPPFRFHPDVEVKEWQENPLEEKYPLLIKEYKTPKGTLRTEIRKTEDWVYGDTVPLYSDLAIPRSRAKKHLIQEPIDLDRLSYLLKDPSSGDIDGFREKVGDFKKFALKHGVLIAGYGGNTGDAAVWLCGMDDLILLGVDNPDFVESLLSIFQRLELRRIQILLENGIDVIMHRAWYESPDFWGPTLWRRFFSPLIREQVNLVHETEAKFGYILSKGIMHIMDDLVDLGVDVVIHGVDPVQDNVDIHKLKQRIGNKVCVTGGVNSYVTVERGTYQEIERAVTEAIKVLAPGGGFIMNPADCIYQEREKAWPKLMFIRDLRDRLGTYPISV